MAAQQQQFPPHAWSGANKTLTQILQERSVVIYDLPPVARTQRQLGLYFSHMEDVWTSARCAVVDQDFSNIKRTTSQGKLYDSCYKYIRNAMKRSDRSSSTANQIGNAHNLDPLGNVNGQAAHLLSHAPVCHRAYPFLAEAAVGINIEDFDDLEGDMPTNRRKLLVGVEGGHHSTSLKGHKYNKMYLKGQQLYFDTDAPTVLVVPLLTMNQIKNWAMDVTHAVEYDVAVFTFGESRQVAATELLPFAKGTCTLAEVEQARENVAFFVKGIAAHLVSKAVFESLPGDEFFTRANLTLCRWRELVRSLKQNPEILIPTRIVGANANNARIAKARMSTGTSLPDPWLLLAKSAINYSASNGQKLMPACPLPEESDDEDDDYGTPSEESNGEEDEKEFYMEALRRGGFGCGEESMAADCL